MDSSVLDTLIDLKRERATTKQRLARLAEAGGHVSDAVLVRVRKDYEGRLESIEERAKVLKEQARQSYLELKPQLESAQKAFETFRLDEEEIRLRHELGEFSDDEYRSRVARLGESRRGAEGQQAELSELVARFVGAFDSPDDLDPSLKLGSGGLAIAVPVVKEALDEDHTWVTPPEDRDQTRRMEEEPEESPEPPAEDVAEDAAEPAAEAPAALEPPPPPPPPLPPPIAEAPQAPAPPDTVEAGVVNADEMTKPHESGAVAAGDAEADTARPRLEALDDEIEPRSFVLEPLTFVGRTAENQIRIYKPAVSRRHAQIADTPDGWLLRDLSSENGTYVNGQRITERTLVDGDRVQFGTSRFLFKST
ncbi:MAG: FHA domain-containing protein [Thermoanaerobaculia bacterium]